MERHNRLDFGSYRYHKSIGFGFGLFLFTILSSGDTKAVTEALLILIFPSRIRPYIINRRAFRKKSMQSFPFPPPPPNASSGFVPPQTPLLYHVHHGVIHYICTLHPPVPPPAAVTKVFIDHALHLLYPTRMYKEVEDPRALRSIDLVHPNQKTVHCSRGTMWVQYGYLAKQLSR